MDSTRRLLPEAISPSDILDTSPPLPKKYLGFTIRQFKFLITYGLYNVFRGVYMLIIGPFYPPEASHRGITRAEIGLVMGAFNLAVFFSILLYGKLFIPRCGPHSVIVVSTFVTSICATLFGCMGFIKERTNFLVASFVLRIIGGAGDAGFYPAAYAIFAVEFPDLVSTTISLFEIFFGIGAILGPIACGPLIDDIGFEWMYITVGGCLLLCSIFIVLVTPSNSHYSQGEQRLIGNNSFDSGSSGESCTRYGCRQLLKIPAIQFTIFCQFSTAASIGFIMGTLQVYLEQFHLSSLEVGSVFSVTTGIYTISSLAWAQFSDRLRWNNIIIITSGSILIAAGFGMLGPLTFLLEKPYLWPTLVGLCLHGVGIGSSIIVSFAYASTSALKRGFPNTTTTNGLVSSILALPFALGLAFGPAASSILFEAVGFQFATIFVIALSFIIVIWSIALLIYNRAKRRSPQQVEVTT